MVDQKVDQLDAMRLGWGNLPAAVIQNADLELRGESPNDTWRWFHRLRHD
jgi:hypothetical protein